MAAGDCLPPAASSASLDRNRRLFLLLGRRLRPALEPASHSVPERDPWPTGGRGRANKQTGREQAGAGERQIILLALEITARTGHLLLARQPPEQTRPAPRDHLLLISIFNHHRAAAGHKSPHWPTRRPVPSDADVALQTQLDEPIERVWAPTIKSTSATINLLAGRAEQSRDGHGQGDDFIRLHSTSSPWPSVQPMTRLLHSSSQTN